MTVRRTTGSQDDGPAAGAPVPFAFRDVAPVQQPTAARAVVDQILGMVKAGNLRPDDKLPPERVLAERFAVSRGTVREALAALAVLGVVRTRQGGGITVSSLKAAELLSPLAFFLSLGEVEVDELYAARGLIEGEIARLAATRATHDDRAALAGLIARQRAVREDPIAYRDADSLFHQRLAAMAHNEFLARAAASLNVLGLEFRRVASETPKVIALSIRDHERILAAIESEDGEAAEAAMRAHMRTVLATTRASIEAASRSRSTQ